MDQLHLNMSKDQELSTLPCLHLDMQSQAIYDDQNKSKKSLHILEDIVSGVQVGDIEQVIVCNLFTIG